MVMGWRTPLILLPANVKSHLTPKQLDGVLLHELAHVKTHDYAVNFLQLLAETFFFYHPALWWVFGVVRQEREYRCDDLAAQACGDRRDYAEALLALEKARSRPTAAVALAGTVETSRRAFSAFSAARCPIPELLAWPCDWASP